MPRNISRQKTRSVNFRCYYKRNTRRYRQEMECRGACHGWRYPQPSRSHSSWYCPSLVASDITLRGNLKTPRLPETRPESQRAQKIRLKKARKLHNGVNANCLAFYWGCVQEQISDASLRAGNNGTRTLTQNLKISSFLAILSYGRWTCPQCFA